jgi:ABC-type branched-subunit amino acid transport system substrate-binding protein
MTSLGEILAEDVVAVIGPEGAEIARAALPVLNRSDVLLISPVVSGASTIEVDPAFPWIRLAPSPAILGRAFANYLKSEKNLEILSAVSSDEDYNRDFIEALIDRFVQLGGLVETSVALDIAKLSYSDEVQSLRMGTTKNIVLSASTKIGARFVNDLTISENSEAEHWQWYLSPALETPVFLQNTIYNALEGAVGIGIEVYDPAEEFISDFKDRWNDTPGEGAFYYFDAIAMLALAMETAMRDNDKMTFDALLDGFSKVAVPSGILVRWQQIKEGFSFIQDSKGIYYSGLTGTLLFDEYGQQQKAAMNTWIVKNGQIEADDVL